MNSVLQPALDKVRTLHPQNGPGMCNHGYKGAPDLGFDPTESPTTSWEELSARATECADTHTIKLVLSLKRLDAIRPDPANRYAAIAVVTQPW